MEATITLDDELVSRAMALTGTCEQTALLHEALQALIARESARHLALLGGSDPDASVSPRSRDT